MEEEREGINGNSEGSFSSYKQFKNLKRIGISDSRLDELHSAGGEGLLGVLDQLAELAEETTFEQDAAAVEIISSQTEILASQTPFFNFPEMDKNRELGTLLTLAESVRVLRARQDELGELAVDLSEFDDIFYHGLTKLFNLIAAAQASVEDAFARLAADINPIHYQPERLV